MTAETNNSRPADEMVDVLIIGSGASGAAVAWSLTRACASFAWSRATG
jgi:cation diffusion facilitator CzcD-associated flavoprotein CzcO